MNKIIATIIRFVCIGILLTGGFYFGQRYKECPPCSEAKPEPKIEFEQSPNKIVQAIMQLQDSSWMLETWAYSNGIIVVKLKVWESNTPGVLGYSRPNGWFVPKITPEIKKEQHHIAQKILDEYLLKIKPYEP